MLRTFKTFCILIALVTLSSGIEQETSPIPESLKRYLKAQSMIGKLSSVRSPETTFNTSDGWSIWELYAILCPTELLAELYYEDYFENYTNKYSTYNPNLYSIYTNGWHTAFRDHHAEIVYIDSVTFNSDSSIITGDTTINDFVTYGYSSIHTDFKTSSSTYECEMHFIGNNEPEKFTLYEDSLIELMKLYGYEDGKLSRLAGEISDSSMTFIDLTYIPSTDLLQSVVLFRETIGLDSIISRKRGDSTSYQYNANNILEEKITYNSSNNPSTKTVYYHNNKRELTSVANFDWDNSSQEWKYGYYDSLNFGYDGNGNLSLYEVIDFVNGSAVIKSHEEYQYDDNSNLTAIIDGVKNPGTTLYKYDSNNNIIGIGDEDSDLTRISYKYGVPYRVTDYTGSEIDRLIEINYLQTTPIEDVPQSATKKSQILQLNNTITVSGLSGSMIPSMKIYNLQGREIAKVTGTPVANNNIQFKLNDLAQGLYVYTITHAQGQICDKIAI